MADAQAVIDDIDSKIKALRSDAEDTLDRLESFATMPFQTWVDFAEAPAFEPSAAATINKDDLPELTKPSLPNSLVLDSQAFERYDRHVWNAADLDALQAKLMDWIESGGSGISEEVQQAIFDQDKERKAQALRDGMDLAGARTGARGFRYPNSMTKASQNELVKRWQDDQTNTSREITRLIADLAQKNVQFAMTEGVKVEQLHADFAIRYADLFRSLMGALLDKYRAETSAYIAEYDAQMRYVLANVDIARTNADMEQGYQRLLLEKWSKEVSNATTRTQALIQQAEQATQVKLSAAKSVSESYIGLMNSMQSNAIVSLTGS